MCQSELPVLRANVATFRLCNKSKRLVVNGIFPENVITLAKINLAVFEAPALLSK